MYLLDNPVQEYAWGSPTAIPTLLGRAPTGRPQAELWLGAHPSAPSVVTVDGRRTGLDAVVAADPRGTLGDAVAARFGALPFLLKVLAAAQPLSLQAHPTLEQAREGFAREEAAGVPLAAAHRSYRDPNHKPELLCALTPFEALCGFRRHADTARLLGALQVPALGDPAAGARELFGGVMGLPPAAQAGLARAVVEACRSRPAAGFERECAWAVRLGERSPGDVGVVGALMLNLVHLQPGQALFLPAGNLHAYLEGVGVEVMASSDNVLRGGLTPKHVDVGELLRIVDFRDGPVAVLEPRGAPEAVYETPAPDFRLSRLDVRGPLGLARRGPDVLLCVEGEVRVTAGRTEVLGPGGAVFVPAADGALAVDGRGTAFRATVGG